MIMNHFKFTFLLTLLMSMAGTKVFAYDIAVENADGVTIYYNYTNDGKELEVTAQGIYSRTIHDSNFNIDYTHYYSTGYSNINILKIPSEVSYMGRLRKVTSIGDHAFTNSVYTYNENSPSYRKNCVYNKFTDIYLPPTIKKIGEDAFASYYTSSPSSPIPLERIHIEDLSQWCRMDFYKGYFGYSGRYELLLNETVLKDINIPNGTTEINDWAFASCDNLQSVTIPNSVTNIGSNAFQYCLKLTSISIPNSVTSIGNSAFYGCGNLTSITIPNSVTSIEPGVFYQCGLTSITIPNSVTSIKAEAFYWCSNLTSITIPNSVTTIGNSAFQYCSGLTSVTIGNSVTSIGYMAFNDCSGLTSVTIPNSVTSIGYMAFCNCNNLTSITIPNSVKSIDDKAFYFNNIKGDMVEINSMIMEPMDINENTFSSTIFNNASFYIPKGTMNLYKACEGWKKFVWIEEKEMTGINNTVKNDVKDSHYYSLDGKHLIEPQPGVNIIRMKDGTTRKVVVN